MKPSDFIALGSAILALLSFVGALTIFAISKRRENYQNLLERISFYSSPEMLMSIQRLWNLYREHGENDFADKYIKIMNSENEKVKATGCRRAARVFEVYPSLSKKDRFHILAWIGSPTQEKFTFKKNCLPVVVSEGC